MGTSLVASVPMSSLQDAVVRSRGAVSGESLLLTAFSLANTPSPMLVRGRVTPETIHLRCPAHYRLHCRQSPANPQPPLHRPSLPSSSLSALSWPFLQPTPWYGGVSRSMSTDIRPPFGRRRCFWVPRLISFFNLFISFISMYISLYTACNSTLKCIIKNLARKDGGMPGKLSSLLLMISSRPP